MKKELLDRNLYRQIKSMDKDTMSRTLGNIYRIGKEGIPSEIEPADIDLEKMRSEIGAIKGIGETRLDRIMEIIKKNLNIKAEEYCRKALFFIDFRYSSNSFLIRVLCKSYCR